MGFFSNLFSPKKFSHHQSLVRKYASCNDLSKSRVDYDISQKPESLPGVTHSPLAYGKQEAHTVAHDRLHACGDSHKQAALEYTHPTPPSQPRCPYTGLRKGPAQQKPLEPSIVPIAPAKCPFDHRDIPMSTEAVYMAPNAAPKCPFDQPLVNPYERPNSRESSESTVLDILGEDKVELLVERFYHYNLTDRKTRLFFQGVNIERLQRMQTTFLIHLLGGKQMNMTRMRAAHKRLLDLNDSHFDAMLKNLTKAGKDLGISSELRERILAAAETTRDDVLGRNSAHEVAQQRRR